MSFNPNLPRHDDTIVALASAPGRAGVGVIRLSGPQVARILTAIVGEVPPPRTAGLRACRDAQQDIIDYALILWFPAPHSFTGEDVGEIQAHGSPVVLDVLIARLIDLGARLARPGEFSERAFLNQKMDLAQAEGIADLIDSASVQAAKSALRSLSGDFSAHIDTVAKQLLHVRMYVEAAIDFPDEEVAFLSDGRILQQLQQSLTLLQHLLSQAKQGALLREGVTIALAGAPNVGKSSLLNRLSGQDRAIVTPIPGTTRDILREHITLAGIPMTIIDTAGLRDSDDLVEQEGIKRAKHAALHADLCLLLVDGQATPERHAAVLLNQIDLPEDIKTKTIIVINKIDATGEQPQLQNEDTHPIVWISAKENQGLALLTQTLLEHIGYTPVQEGVFLARRRHLTVLNEALAKLNQTIQQFITGHASELLAEDLRIIHDKLGEITGRVSSDDLLGTIFSQFCIGK